VIARHVSATTINPNPIVVANRNGTAIAEKPTRRRTAATNAQMATPVISVRTIEMIEAGLTGAHRSFDTANDCRRHARTLA
jgi:hypothetical protein